MNSKAENKINLNPIRGLYGGFLLRTLFVLVLMCALIFIGGGIMYSRGVKTEVKAELSNVAQSVLNVYDQFYPGEYQLYIDDEKGESYLKKGEVIISEDSQYIDSVYERTDIDISLFFYDMRMLTTLKDAEGKRVVNTVAHAAVREAVLEKGEEAFYSSLTIDGKDYFVDYIPVFGSDGTCIGMIATAKKSDDVERSIYKMMSVFALMAAVVIVVSMVIIAKYISDIVGAIRKIMKFLAEISKGKLNTSIDETVFSRDDELGEMARFTVRVQSDLKGLIEKDPLTGLCNRRMCDNKFDETINKTNEYCLALGDIDLFKKVNDTYGHDAGDKVLVMVAKTISQGMAGHGYAVRWGGEEFLLIFENMKIDEAKKILQGILDGIKSQEVIDDGRVIKVTMTMGLITGPYNESLDKYVSKADALLYYGKEHGRDRLITTLDVENDEES